MKKSIFILLLFYLSSCDNPTRNDQDSSIPYDVEVRDISSYNILNFDTITVVSNNNAIYDKKYFSHLILGESNGINEFTPMDTVHLSYIDVDGKYQLTFSTMLYLNSHYSVFNCELRFYYSDIDYLSDVMPIETYKFPYKSSEIFLNTSENNQETAQDFYIFGETLYYIPIGWSCISQYEMDTHQFEEIFCVAAGDLLTGNDSTVYCSDQFGINIFSLKTGKFEPNFDLSELEFERITGIAVVDDMLYTIMWNTDSDINLVTFGIEGKLLETIPYGEKNMYMTVYDSVIYSLKSPTGISRFDLRQQKFLEPLQHPAKWGYGILVRDDFLYYTVYPKGIIAKVPLPDLEILN